jgi:hypothetical protein
MNRSDRAHGLVLSAQRWLIVNALTGLSKTRPTELSLVAIGAALAAA